MYTIPLNSVHIRCIGFGSLYSITAIGTLIATVIKVSGLQNFRGKYN